MGSAVRAGEAGQIKRRRVVHKAAILSSHEDTTREIEIGSAAVDECATPLRTRPNEILRVEDQAAASRQYERREFAHRHTEHVRRGDFVGVALDAQHSAGRAVALGVERIAVVGFNAVMSVEEIAITAQHTTAVSGLVLYAVVGGAFHEATKRLDRDFILIRSFRLRKRRQRRGGDSYNPRHTGSESLAD